MFSKIKNNLMSPNELYYLKYRKAPILSQTILLESTHGREVSGHIFSLAEKLKEDFPEYTIYIVKRKNTSVDPRFSENIVEHMSKEYLRLLATCEYLINDTSFWSFFHKRADQKYFIFWHGTPLKFLGKSTQVQGYGNVQRNLAAADKIFVSNEFTKEKIIEDFGIKDIVHNQIVVAPSPRNSHLFEEKVVSGRYLYMPTWRGVEVANIELSNQMLAELEILDTLLTEGEEMYVKLHPYEAELLNFSEKNYKHLKQYPENEELYHFLQTVEKLVTDYSSIMFDFAVTNRSVILFTFDEEQYLKDRGMYLNLSELPFRKVKKAENLMKELRKTKQDDYQEIQHRYNRFDCIDGTTIVLEYLLKAKATTAVTEYDNWNGKDNVLIYVYRLDDNGITSSLLNLMSTVDLTKRNYIFIWQEGMIPKHLEYKIQELPEQIYTFIQTGKVQSTINEMTQTMLYMNQLPCAKEVVAEMYRRDFDRVFPHLEVNHFIHYPGYDRSYAVWTWALKKNGIKTDIFVHTDMAQEFKINPSLKPKILFEAYQKADNVICVSKPIEDKIQELAPEANTKVMEVLINAENIREIAAKPLPKDLPYTLLKDLENENTQVFVSVGRFSKQKGYDRLIQAFEKLDRKDTRLLLICSYGPEREAIINQIQESSVKNRIYLLDNLVKPYNLVKAADAFVFSSRYEGLGMVVFEALAVETPVIMTEIPETLEVLGDRNKAIVVENSTNGILEGMKVFLMEAPRTTSLFDFDSQTQQSITAWEKLF